MIQPPQTKRNASMKGLQPYPNYREAKAQWTKRIPENWRLRKLKYAAEFTPERASAGSENLPYIGLEHIESEKGKLLELDEETTPDSTVHRFRSGDVLFGKLRPYLAKVWQADRDGDCTSELVVLRPRKGVSPSYLYFQLLAPSFISAVNAQTYGAKMPRVSPQQLGDMYVAVPGDEEQRSISRFLSVQTSRIDDLIAKKERLIELLEEKRTALITQAVTKGLDPDVLMKDSGVEWLGEIPEHWELPRLGMITTSRCDGPFGSKIKSEHYSSEGARVVRLQNIGWAEFRGADTAFVAEDYFERELKNHEVLSNDVLIAGLGDENNPVGRACVAPQNLEPALVKADCFRFRINPSYGVPHFVAYQLSATAYPAGNALSTGATRSRMNLSTTENRRLALPPLSEQQEIVAFVDRKGGHLQQAITKVSMAIKLLEEYRSALITAAVTGKIDVRDHAA